MSESAMLALLFALLSTSNLAAAGTIEAWAYDTFPENGEAVAGTDGWENGYEADVWAGAVSGRDHWAYSITDHDDAGAFGDGGAHDNWLVNAAEPVRQGEYQVTSYVTDNDAFGVVFGSDQKHYYLLLVCGEEGNETSMQNCPVAGLTTHVVALVEIRGSKTTVLDEVEQGGTGDTEVDMVVSMDDDQLVAKYGRVELTATVDDTFTLDEIGFYAYNEGTIGLDGTDDGDTVYFRDPTLSWQDEDDDTVADDEDNCEKVENKDQADLDGDGIGSACDDEEAPPEDTATEDTGDTGDTGNGKGNGKGKKDVGEISISQPGCGCSTPGAVGGVWLGVLGAAAIAGRRRG